MTEPKTSEKVDKPEQSEDAKQAVADSQSPEQKHEAYLKRLETLHNEP